VPLDSVTARSRSTTMTPDNLSERLQQFITWFQQLEANDQQELMDLVYTEHRVRDVVRSFSSMPPEQRKAVFQRLGLPSDILSRIPPAAAAVGDVEVEWQEWQDGPKA
jgi:Asp-tRNA(Asn)/Glu-tRNA(Gln) amidotransferase C subunit